MGSLSTTPLQAEAFAGTGDDADAAVPEAAGAVVDVGAFEVTTLDVAPGAVAGTTLAGDSIAANASSAGSGRTAPWTTLIALSR